MASTFQSKYRTAILIALILTLLHAPKPASALPSVLERYGFNITRPQDLWEITCESTLNGTETDFYTTCPFPMINKGWGDDGEPGFNDVVLNDCSLNMADAFPESYLTLKLILSISNVLLSIWAARNCK